MLYSGGHAYRRKQIKIRQENLSLHPLARILSGGRKGQEAHHSKSVELYTTGNKRYKTGAQSQGQSRRVGLNRVERRIVCWRRLVCEPGYEGIGYREIAGE